MGSHPSGLADNEIELVVIETSELILYIKGKPFHERYESLKSYRTIGNDEWMYFHCEGFGIDSVHIFDVNEGVLIPKREKMRPIFFENGIYQLVVTSKKGKDLFFHHENPNLRKAVSVVGIKSNRLLMGNLKFPNEVGYSTFEITDDSRPLLKVTIEIYPSKLDYKEDYKQLLDEVNEEIYNLAFHFIKKTYLGASRFTSEKPTWSEFYRLLDVHFSDFLKAINFIESQPHHELITAHQKSRGDQLRRVDSYGRNYLRKRPQIFHEVDNGILIDKKVVMPTHGMRMKKSLSFDTLENQFVKWMMERLISKLESFYKQLSISKGPYEYEKDYWLLEKISTMKNVLAKKVRSTFWLGIGKLNRSVMSLVLQMAPGYRDSFQIYLIVSHGLTLNARFYQMSVKDVATLYEYWTFLKLGQILTRKYIPISGNVVDVNHDGLFVNLSTNKSANRVFKHPITDEKIILQYQRRDQSVPTVSQKPDTMLSIEKKGKEFSYHYIFDAKYRIDFAVEGSYYEKHYTTPGPLEEDINTMHRYRDALVVRQNGPYEREAFGAYVLFPWFNEDIYEEHNFYKSINEVNIGGFPFLPNTTRLVEQFIENLIEKSPEELQQQGILPLGTKEDWLSSLDDKVIVANVNNEIRYKTFINEKFFVLPVKQLKKGWQESKYIALYLPKGISSDYQGIYYYSAIEEVEILNGGKIPLIDLENDQEYALFILNPWKSLDQVIRPVDYGISNYVITTLNTLKFSNELPEIFMKSNEEVTLWRMLRRLSNHIRIDLDEKELDNARNITYLNLRNIDIHIDHIKNTLEIENSTTKTSLNFNLVKKQPSKVHKVIVGMLED